VPKRINLLPHTERVRTTTNFGVLALVAAGVIVAFVLGLAYYLESNTRGRLQDELTYLQEEKLRLQDEVAALEEYKVLESLRIETEKVVQSVYAGRTLLSQTLNDLGLVVPSNVWFTQMDLTAADPAGSFVTGAPPASGTGPDTQNSFSVQGNTYSMEEVGGLMGRLRLVQSLSGIVLDRIGAPVGQVDESKGVKGFQMHSSLVNTQLVDEALPVSRVEVEGL
jgi:Tfp pilus assembly protein PilN